MKRYLIGGGIAALFLALVAIVGYHYFTGAGMGGPCSVNDDCKGNIYGQLGSQCYTVEDERQGYCTATCEGAADCPAEWECEKVDFIVRDVKEGAARVCVRRDPAAAAGPAPR